LAKKQLKNLNKTVKVDEGLEAGNGTMGKLLMMMTYYIVQNFKRVRVIIARCETSSYEIC
jgi:hypothetical protein